MIHTSLFIHIHLELFSHTFDLSSTSSQNKRRCSSQFSSQSTSQPSPLLTSCQGAARGKRESSLGTSESPLCFTWLMLFCWTLQVKTSNRLTSQLQDSESMVLCWNKVDCPLRVARGVCPKHRSISIWGSCSQWG